MNKKIMQEQSNFLLTEYQATLESGLSETPEQFLMHMSVDTKVESFVLPKLEEIKHSFNKKNGKNS